MKSLKRKSNSGQVMLLSVLVLSGLLLSATAIAGLLVRYQIRQTTDIENSARAFFAADSAQEWQTYCYWKNEDYFSTGTGVHPCIDPANPTDPAVSYLLEFSDPFINSSSTITVNPTEVYIEAKGYSGRTVRTLEVYIK